MYGPALPAHGQAAAGPPPGWQYLLPAQGQAGPPPGWEAMTRAQNQVAGPPPGWEAMTRAQSQAAGPPPGWQYLAPAHAPVVQAPSTGVKLENLVFVSIFLVFLALLHAAAGSKVTYYFLWVVLFSVVISRWDKINSFLRRYIT